MKLSTAQFRVLHWLWLYPTVQIHYVPNNGALIMPQWYDENSRQHMIGVMGILGTDANVACRGATQRGTPRMTQRTFDALCRMELLRPIGQRPVRKHVSPCVYYQLSDDGLRVVRESASAG